MTIKRTSIFRNQKGNIAYWFKATPVLISIIGLLIGAAVWASSEHLGIRDYSNIQDEKVERKVEENLEKYYVPLHRFTKQEEAVENIEYEITEMKDDQKKAFKKIDDLHQIFLKSERNRYITIQPSREVE